MYTNDNTQIKETDHYLPALKDNKNAYIKAKVHLRKKLKSINRMDYDTELDKIRNNMKQSLNYLKTREELYKEQVKRIYKLERFVVGNIGEVENRIGEIVTILSQT